MRRYKISERRACKVVGQHRATQRYKGIEPKVEEKLIAEMNRIATAHPRWGYRMVGRILRNRGWVVNEKKVERLWRQEGHKVPPRRSKDTGKRSFGAAENSSWNRPADGPNHTWSYDFVSCRTSRGSAFRILNVVDEFTRIALGSKVSRTIGALEVVATLQKLFEEHGKPKVIRSDNGREFIAATVVEWLAEQGVKPAFIEKGSPQQNPFVERFNGTMRNELLNGEQFDSLLEARVMIAAWIEEYNTQRPHRGLGMMTPFEFANRRKVVGK